MEVETITAEGGETEVDYEDKGYVTVVKTPRCPHFEILHPTICSGSNEFAIYSLLDLWSSGFDVEPVLMDERGHVCFYLYFISIKFEHRKGQ